MPHGAADPTLTLVSPFLTEWSPEMLTDEASLGEMTGVPMAAEGAGLELASPFRFAEVDPSTGQADAASPLARRAGEVFQELRDEAFEEALADLVNEVSAVAAELPVREAPDAGTRRDALERMLNEHFDPVVRAGEQLLDDVGARVGQETFAPSEAQLEEMLASVVQPSTGPQFEGFLKALRSLAGRAVKAVKNVANVALGPLIARLKRMVRPIVEAAIKFGLARVPSPLRDTVRRLGERVLTLLGEIPQAEAVQVAGEGEPGEAEDSRVPVTELEQHVRGHLTAMLLAPDETSQEAVVERFAAESASAAEDHLAALEDAREQFVHQVTALGEGESLQPALEEFIPAIIAAVKPVVRALIGMIGRDRVVDTLVGVLAPLLQRFVQPDLARQASRFLVDAGLSLISESEVDGSGVPRAVAAGPVSESLARAIAHTVEETLADLPAEAEVLRDPTSLAARTLESFERAAATAVPNLLVRPSCRAVTTLSGVFRPVRRTVYLVFSQVPTVEISPSAAGAVRTFGGVTLRSFLRSRYGVPVDGTSGGKVRARVHIFQLATGGSLPDVVAGERRIPGLGPRPEGGMRTAITKFHPLTTQAAAVLLGEPCLGRDLEPRYLTSRARSRVGGRYYFLEVIGARDTGPVPTPASVRISVSAPAAAAIAPGPSGSPAVASDGTSSLRPVTVVTDHRGRSSEANITLQPKQEQIRIGLFLSEPRAQEVAKLIRERAHPAQILRTVSEVAREMVSTIKRSGPLGHLRIETETVQAEGELPAFLVSLVTERLLPTVMDWAMKRVADHLKVNGGQFLAAANDPTYGVTIVVLLRGVKGLRLLSSTPADLVAFGLRMSDLRPDQADVQIVPGFTR